jgi:hypothetical protein
VEVETRNQPWVHRGLPGSPLWLTALPVLAFLLIYLPDVGHGFISDDFAWIKGSRAAFLQIFESHNGFYRPLVSLSFAANESFLGLAPRGYGLTNLALAIGCAAAITALARALGLPPGGAFFAGGLWLLNPHGISMSVLWISGRTALLLTLFAVLCATALVKAQRAMAAAFYLLALFSKEEAVLLLPVLVIWAGWRADPSRVFDARGALVRTWPLLVSLLIYSGLRSRTGAYLPLTAPPFYQPTLAPLALLRNVIEYADRSCTIGVLSLVGLSALVGKLPRLTAALWHPVRLGLVWLLGGFGLTVFLPVRSSLYACFPSVGSALAAGAVATAVFRAAPVAARRRVLVAAAVVPLLVVPIYRRRNVRWVTPADISARVIEAIRPGDLPPATAVVLKDENGLIARGFGTVFEEALRLTVGRPDLHVWLEPPPLHWPYAGLRPVQEGEPAVRYELRDRRLVRAP